MLEPFQINEDTFINLINNLKHPEQDSTCLMYQEGNNSGISYALYNKDDSSKYIKKYCFERNNFILTLA